MVAVEGIPNDLPTSLRDLDRGATNWPKLKIMCIGAEIYWAPVFLFLFGKGRRVDETAPMSGGIKSSGCVLVKKCRTKKINSLAGDQPPKNQSGNRRSVRIT